MSTNYSTIVFDKLVMGWLVIGKYKCDVSGGFGQKTVRISHINNL